MKKYLILIPLLFAMPSTAIAQSVVMLNQLPANFMIWRGKVYDLNHLAGKGVAAIPQTQIASTNPSSNALRLAELEQRFITRKTRENRQRVENENARAQILLERLKNMP